eukprot:TRINITY_DN6281_c0_g1_i2.p1 TRINITY_DN6281_c0_g1~~TRINITY_DN6281_c0_g1_i2.p1  ORF type:complete len:301 (-),score=54.74 TRINITY_DN6281_c0_g1_i2:46-948(-)
MVSPATHCLPRRPPGKRCSKTSASVYNRCFCSALPRPSASHATVQAEGCVLRGVPYSMRKDVWLLLSGCAKVRQQSPTPNLYQDLVEHCTPCVHADAILLDVNRCVAFFDKPCVNKESVTRLLQAIVAYRPDMGYHQSFSILVCHTLYHTGSEEDTFWLLLQLFDHCNLGVWFAEQSDLPAAVNTLCTLLLCKYLPLLAAHLKSQHLSIDGVIVRWFTTVFSYSFPMELSARIWDWVLLKGIPAIFQVALAVLFLAQDQLLQVRDTELLLAVNNLCTRGGWSQEQCDALLLVAAKYFALL